MGQKIVSKNPADNYNIIGQVDVTQVSDIPKIIRKSRTALKTWQNIKLDIRQKFIQKVVLFMSLFLLRSVALEVLTWGTP